MMRSILHFVDSQAQTAFLALVLMFWISEFIIGQSMRAGATDRTDDRGSLQMLFVAFPVGWIAGWFCLIYFPQASFGNATAFFAGIGVMIVGQLLRWWSIATLGRLFTVNVAIRAEHRLIDSGPYRYVRHPSYTAILLFYLGMTLCLGNGLCLAAVMIPSTLALLNRIRVEEHVLVSGLGDIYRAYMSRTKRLIPGVY